MCTLEKLISDEEDIINNVTNKISSLAPGQVKTLLENCLRESPSRRISANNIVKYVTDTLQQYRREAAPHYRAVMASYIPGTKSSLVSILWVPDKH